MAESEAIVAYIPLETAVPPLPTEVIFSEPQWKTLLALADAVIPSIRSVESGSVTTDKLLTADEYKSTVSKLSAMIPTSNATELAEQYLQESASSLPQFKDSLQRTFSLYVHDEGRKGVALILTLLNTVAGSLILTGSHKMIYDQPLAVREKIFRGWATSRLPPLRMIYRALGAAFKKSWITVSPSVCPVVGFPRVPVHGKPADSFPYEFLQFPPGSIPETIETDVVIVGSGCGAAVAAKNLAEAGHRVVVVEKSYFYENNHFPMGFNEAAINLFDSGGATISDDATMAVISGSTWGGGGTINWSASLQTQAYVREEWAREGLPFFTSHEFQTSLDRVCDRMGVQTDATKHNFGNQLILDGARKLGYAAHGVPQNTGRGEHYCGYCTLGCHSGGKKGPTESWLIDAAKAGAVFVEGFRADRVLFSRVGNERVASGVEGTWTSRDSHLGTSGKDVVRRKVVIKAPRVVVGCGTLSSPLLLLRSGIKNSQIGRNLHLHPVIIATAVFDEEIRPWEGSALTTVVSSFENLDGQGHGVKIEAATMIPSMVLPTFPWRDGLDFKLFVAKLARSTSFITLTREREPGRVYPDPVDGRCRIDYTTSAFDRRHILEALIACAKIAYISGAKEFHTTYGDMRPFIRPADAPDPQDGEGINNAALQAWIAEFRSKAPLNAERATFASAHQMGTCRMGSSPKKSVVDPNCQVWGTSGLYVMDASVFPSASGVNPMVTNMAISDWASRKLAQSMKSQSSANGVRARL